MPVRKSALPTPRRAGAGDRAEPGRRARISRRKFLRGLAALAAAGMLGAPRLVEPQGAQAEAPASAAAGPAPVEIGPVTGAARADQAFAVRVLAAQYAREQPLPDHPDNGDEARYANKIASYTKLLPHDDLGEVDLAAYDTMIRALTTGSPADFEAITLGGAIKLVNPQAALAFDLQGPDSHQLAIPPAPAFSSPQEAAEMGELYWQALARDVPFSQYGADPVTRQAAEDLSRFSDFRGPTVGGQVTAETLFRGVFPGDLTGPYISQFLWLDIPYGAQPIAQRMRTALPGDDYMTAYDEWLAIQNGAVAAHDNNLDPTLRYIRNGRDLAEWVHRDFPYQSLLNAALILTGLGAASERGEGLLPEPGPLAEGGRELLPGSLVQPAITIPFAPSNPYQQSRTQTGFATFGIPDVLAAVASVTNCALKAAWYQKWLVQRRLRPEEYGGRLHNLLAGKADYPIHEDLLRSPVLGAILGLYGSYLLPQAYPEGCPAHPAYPSGHAAFVGAGCTVLKAFFDESLVIPNPVVAGDDGVSLHPFTGPDLTAGGELNKLASNIALGRSFAGVHYRSCALEGLLLGEAVAIGFLAERALTYNESFPGFTFTRFDGSTITVGAHAVEARLPVGGEPR